MQDPEFWDNPEKSKPILQKRRGVERRVESLKGLRRDADDLEAWRELVAEGEGDPDLQEFLARLEKDLERLELELKLSGPDDARSAIVSIHPGAGGTESQDWAEMLLRMYLRWAERHGFGTQVVSISSGEEAGIKSVSVR
ncbi:MAG: PCRF domain-containing protein, partial [Holophagales bacterium]|nr:PCRF domain-containing protein [Holophagales bacterium]